MRNINIGSLSAAAVSGFLCKLGNDRAIPADLRANAADWARGMARTMDRRDLQTVAWLLLHASGEQRVPFTHRCIVGCWVAYLEGRSWGVECPSVGRRRVPS
jgi:hypothetical protein